MERVDAIAWMLAARHDETIANTPEYQEASSLVAADAALAVELEEQQALYDRQEDYLDFVRMPEDARERIKKALRDAAGETAPPIAFPWRPLAMAASLAALLAIGYIVTQSDSTRPGAVVEAGVSFDSFRDFAAAQVESGFSLDFRSAEAQEVVAWLEDAGSVEVELGERFGELSTMGCKAYAWNGQPVSLICFQVESGVAHLFVTPAASLSGTEIASAAEAGGRNTLSWVNGASAYVLVAHEPGQSLSAFSI